jgi:hypothetical protein
MWQSLLWPSNLSTPPLTDKGCWPPPWRPASSKPNVFFFFFFFSIFNVLKKEIRIKSKHFSETLQLPNKFTNVTPPNNTFSNVAPTENISIFNFSKHQIKNTCQKLYQTNLIHQKKKKLTVPNKSIVFFSFYLLLEYPYMFFFFEV